MTVQSISITVPEFSLLTMPVPPFDLGVSQSFQLQLIFTPSAGGSFSGSLQISSTATNSPHSVSLSGLGLAPSYAVDLAWDPSTSTVAGYNVYRSDASGGPYTRLNSALVGGTAFTDSTVQPGDTCYYVVKAVDSGGMESVPSNEATATIPAT